MPLLSKVVANALSQFTVRQPADETPDLGMFHAPCGAYLFDVQPDDTMETLAIACLDHLIVCPHD